MNAEYIKAANKLLYGITDKRLREPEIWNDILSSVRSGRLQLWEINDEILRIKYFCKEKIELASTFTETDKSNVRFDDLNEYFIAALESRDKGYFEAFIKAYETALENSANRFVMHYGLSEDDAEDIKQIFLETLWTSFLSYDADDPIPLLQYVKLAVPPKRLEYIRTVKNACSVPSENGYNELRKVMGIYNNNPELSANERIALIVKETGFTEEKVIELVAIGKATEYPIGIVPTEDDEEEEPGAISDELIEDPSVSLFQEAWRNICREYFRAAADKISPKDKQIISLSLGVCFDCFGIFKPNTYAEIALKQGAAGEKSIEKKRKTAIEKFAKELCALGFCDGVALMQKDMVVAKVDGEKKVQSVTYSYTPYCEGEAGEIIYTPYGKHRCHIIRLAENDETGAYAEYVAKIIRYMNGTYLKEKFYAIPLEELSKVNRKNAKPRLPFYKKPSTIEQK